MTTATKTASDYTVDIHFQCETGVSARVTHKQDASRSYLVNMSTCVGGILACTCPNGKFRPNTICRHMRAVVAELESNR